MILAKTGKNQFSIINITSVKESVFPFIYRNEDYVKLLCIFLDTLLSTVHFLSYPGDDKMLESSEQRVL